MPVCVDETVLAGEDVHDGVLVVELVGVEVCVEEGEEVDV